MTTPTPEAVEAAARALSASINPDLDWGTCDQYYQRDLRIDATAALTAAYPLMEAQDKAEALREAADEFGSWGPTGIAAANALRNRANNLEGKDS